ncbi:hypothetical protein CRYUN_Cryun26dG0022500 [Craigia yunnanensis]
MFYFWWLLGVVHLLVWGSTLQTIRAIPPEAPVQCNRTVCTLYNSYGAWGDRQDCHVKSVAYPTIEEDLRLAVAYANKNKLKSDDSMLISTAKYDSHVEIDPANFAVTADAGVALRELIDKVEEAGLSLVAAPYWEGVSVAGLISTGAQGSSWWGKGGAVHDHVIDLSLIVPASESEGYAKVIQIGAQDQLLNAAKLSLGVLGVISKLCIDMTAEFPWTPLAMESTTFLAFKPMKSWSPNQSEEQKKHSRLPKTSTENARWLLLLESTRN